MTCEEIQQRFYENLGDREYDCFRETEDKYLKLKIGYTLFGFPEASEGLNNLNGDFTVLELYKKEQNEIINNIHSVVKAHSIYNEDKDQTMVSFMFNCCEFLEKKIFKRRKDEEKKIGCFPIFRIRKCYGSPTNKNCCFYVDENGRVYKNWIDYLTTNKIPKAKMFVPKDGKYQGDQNDIVQLDELLSPACGLKENLVKVADYSTTAASLVSGGIAVGAMIPALTVAPIVLTGALVTGAGVGVYSIIRSSLVLHDRKKHSQSISLKSQEARNCYLNIATGATSVITTGATKAATIALNRGITIGEGAVTALMSVNVLNISINGCNLANSIYSIANDIKNKRNPSTLDIMHMTTTFLFFGNAVINFKSACTIYNETRTNSFANMVQNQSQNLWTRAKSKFFKTDMTRIDNNSRINVINNSGDYCSNFLNVPLRERASEICQNSALNLLANLIRNIDVDSIVQFGQTIIENRDNVYAVFRIILTRFESSIQETLLKVFKFFYDEVIQSSFDVLQAVFPKNEKVIILLNFVINFFKFKVAEMEIEYQQKKASAVRDRKISDDEYDDCVGGFKSTAERMQMFLKIMTLKMICSGGRPEELLFREMIKFFWDWLSEKAYEHTLKNSQSHEPNNQEIYRKCVDCTECGGFYFV